MDLTYDSAVKRSLVMEAALQNAKEMQGTGMKKDNVDEQVHAVQQRMQRSYDHSSPQPQ